MTEAPMIVCARPGGGSTPGSIIVTATCGHDVLLSVSGQAVVAEGGRPVCHVCAIPMMPPGVLSIAAPGALEEIDRAYGEADRAQAETVMTMLGIKPYLPCEKCQTPLTSIASRLCANCA